MEKYYCDWEKNKSKEIIIMKITVIGCNGQLGQEMMNYLRERNCEVLGIDYPEIDITQKEKTLEILKKIYPEIIINCTGFTSVDVCEKEIYKSYAINARGVEHLAFAANQINSTLIHYSTDYIFDGKKQNPYLENDLAYPLSIYGKSKLFGELLLQKYLKTYYILRIAWLYSAYGTNFVKRIVQLAKEREKTGEPIKVVKDQFGTPTYAYDVCQQTWAILTKRPEFGIYHATNEGFCSWFEFASQIFTLLNIKVPLLSCTTQEFPRPASRPAYSVLENGKLKALSLNFMPEWEKSLAQFLKSAKSI